MSNQTMISDLQEIVKGKSVLFAVLNWGLGHATRSSVIIGNLLESSKNIIIASDGQALSFLVEKFPSCPYIELPSYKVTYPYQNLILNTMSNSYNIILAKSQEHDIVENYCQENRVDLIISDCRFGCYVPSLPSYIITHQTQVQHHSRLIKKLMNLINLSWLKKFDEIWIPDYYDRRLSGLLSNNSPKLRAIKFIGPLSLVPEKVTDRKVDILVLLSGPEPQRSILSRKLLEYFSTTKYIVAFVEGKEGIAKPNNNAKYIQHYGLVKGDLLVDLINSAKVIVCRSGYSTIMDLHHLQKEVIFIPTPGQPEQEYLARFHAKSNPRWFQLKHSDISIKLTSLLNYIFSGKAPRKL